MVAHEVPRLVFKPPVHHCFLRDLGNGGKEEYPKDRFSAVPESCGERRLPFPERGPEDEEVLKDAWREDKNNAVRPEEKCRNSCGTPPKEPICGFSRE